jgi:8-hydroxy-5-deazaflavin:NADPH oxidoreductase
VGTMKVGILGSGDVARALGTGFVACGHQVLLGTRHPDQPKIVEWVRSSSGKGSAASFSDAARQGEMVVLAVMGVAGPDAIRSAGIDHFTGKTVVDVTNPLVFRENAPPALAIGHTTSAGEEVQKLLPKAHVVKAFNIVGNAHFFKPNFPGGPPDMYICGNDAGAKKQVEKTLHEFGWPSVIDIGGIEGARELETLCVLWVKTALKLGNWNIAFKVLRKEAKR